MYVSLKILRWYQRIWRFSTKLMERPRNGPPKRFFFFSSHEHVKSNRTIFGARCYRSFVTAPSFFPGGLPFIRPSHLSSLTAENNVISANNSALLQKDPSCRSPEDPLLESRASILGDPRRRQQIRLRRRASAIGSSRDTVLSENYAKVPFRIR